MTLRQGTRHIAPRFSPKCIIDVPRKDYQVAKPLEEERSHFSNPFKATLAPDRWTPPQTDERWNRQQAEGGYCRKWHRQKCVVFDTLLERCFCFCKRPTHWSRADLLWDHPVVCLVSCSGVTMPKMAKYTRKKVVDYP